MSGDVGPRRAGPSHGGPLRTDIQGLRAIAVLTVVAAHYGIGPLPGGFVGVDVFFVVSGFLISQMLYREVSRTGRVSLAGFYARRARRILPAATVVTVVTLLASVLLLTLVDTAALVTDALWATLFAANVRFASTGVDYFAQDQGDSPLQHYWSLAVEEQFYLVWPLLLLGCLAWAARRGSRAALPRATVFAALLAVTALSIGWSLWATAASPETAYFSTFARAWELGVGALVALVGPHVVRPLTPRARGLLAGTGLGAVLLACAVYTEATPFPGLAAALPVLGTAAVLLAGTGQRRDRRVPGVLRALGARPLQVVGDWSYSLYLWHWPVLVVLESRSGALGPVATALALLLTFLLAALTYRFVETPFRSPVRFTVPRALVLYPVSLAVVVAACTAGSHYTRWAGGERGDNPAITLADFETGASGTAAPAGPAPVQDRAVAPRPDPAVALVRASVAAARRDVAVPSDLSPDLLDVRADVPGMGACDYTDDEVRELCPGGDPDAERSIVVLGDSHGRAWMPALDRVAEEAGYTTYHLVKVQCTAADVQVVRRGEDEPWAGCTDFHRWAQQQLEELQPDLVVVSTSAPGAVHVGGERVSDPDEVAAELRAGFDRLLVDVAPTTDRLVLLKDVPRAPEDPAACLAADGGSLQRCLFEPDPDGDRMAAVSVAAARAAGVEVVDPRRWFCWDGSCPAVVGSTLTYRDPGHITATYAAELAEPLGRALGLLDPAYP